MSKHWTEALRKLNACPYCDNPLLGSDGPLVRIGPNQHAHRACLEHEEQRVDRMVEADIDYLKERRHEQEVLT
jgi:hypothetical protein